MSKKKWIQKAIKHPGALKQAAKRKGMTVAQYCAQPKSALSLTDQRRCNLYHTLMKMHRK